MRVSAAPRGAEAERKGGHHGRCGGWNQGDRRGRRAAAARARRVLPTPGSWPRRGGAAGGGRGAGASLPGLPRAGLDAALRPRALLLGDAPAGRADRGRVAAAEHPGKRARALRRPAHGLAGPPRAPAQRGGGGGCDVFFCDQVSACIPILRLARTRKKVLFYCHFPDQLLTKRESFIKRIYRKPLDWLEEYTTGMADCILVNSCFTANVFKQTFKTLSHVNPEVLYPSLNFSKFDTVFSADAASIFPNRKKFLFLSINRYERKKDLELALKALHDLRGKLNAQEWSEVHMVLAGGYDEAVRENVEYYEELKAVVAKLNIVEQVTFLRSFSDEQKIALLSNCLCVLYTPSNEHFGIVPLEAMYMKCPVIAVNSGGPLESVVNNETGFLCDPFPTKFSEAMEKLVKDPALKRKMGAAGRARVLETFSSEAFIGKLYQYICSLTQ
ncbi:hypothetical protein JRQ81_005232 [Phrynocephalus forsythii]|uniref:Alpha-1,3/1,6-mannosyltransferase ALG2 n=1 Tax=Phrynocephalus forsythii TaxID=171643 RepID=A0A9Q0XG42_9SAUR|nr:hypothetical protein JRQ81_005232 [Phrynocephalus forsythii]